MLPITHGRLVNPKIVAHIMRADYLVGIP